MGQKPIKALQDPSNEGRLYGVFRKYNKSKTGSLTKDEFQNVLNEMKKDGGACFNTSLLEDSVDNLFAIADNDKDGVLAYLEFKEWLESVLIGAKPKTAHRAEEYVPIVSVMIVGKPKSGKTSFVLSAVGDNEALQSGILPKFDYKKKEITFDGHKMVLNIYDPPNRLYANKAGHVDEEFYSVFKKADGLLLAFDVTDRTAFKKPIWTQAFLDEWKEKKGDAPVVLVACKCDTHHERILFEDTIEENAEKFGKLPWFETQAKTGVGIDDPLEEMGRLLWKTHGK